MPAIVNGHGTVRKTLNGLVNGNEIETKSEFFISCVHYIEGSCWEMDDMSMKKTRHQTNRVRRSLGVASGNLYEKMKRSVTFVHWINKNVLGSSRIQHARACSRKYDSLA